MESERRVAIILGDCERGEPKTLASEVAGAEGTPIQFDRIFGASTLFEQTRERVALAFPADRTLTVVTRTHRRFYESMLRDMLRSRLVEQPRNRGTAPAILYALLRIQATKPEASVAIFPSQHYIEDNAAFMRQVDLAFEGIRTRPDLLVLLGATPDSPEADNCWIEMGDRIAEYLRLFRIQRFWRSPSREMAMRLWQLGCLWNSSVFVGELQMLATLMREVFPQLSMSFDVLRSTSGTTGESESLEAIYSNISHQDFSHEISVSRPRDLTVLPIAGIEWSDPARLHGLSTTARRFGIRPK